MRFFYDLSIKLYYLLIRIASCSNTKAQNWINGRKEVWSTLEEKNNPTSSYFWFHCASLGEFEQGRPLIERIKKQNPAQKIVITFFSPSGYEVRKNYEYADIVVYLPLDTPRNAKRFLSSINISKAFFIKYEFWYHFLSELNRNKIDTYLVSGIFRPSQIFFKSYGKWYARILKSFRHLYVQNDISEKLLNQIGINNVSVVGDTRFDRVHDIAELAAEIEAIATFKQDKKLIVCGSTWGEDERILIDFINQTQDVQWIIAPHEVKENHILALEEKLQKRTIRFSNLKNSKPTDFEVIIADGYGYLTSLYRYGDIAYVGGGFGKGIHNILEAATYGVPILFGPKHSKFKEAKDLKSQKGAFAIHNKESLNNQLELLLNDGNALKEASQICKDYISQNTGASEVIIGEIL